MSAATAERRRAGTVTRTLLLLARGLAVGIATAFGQAHLSGMLNAFVNSASAWLVAPFLVGSRMTSERRAAVAGFAVCTVQLLGYYMTSELRGFASGGAIVVYWAACAVAGGPLFGVAGRLWRTRPDRLGGLGAAVLAAAFLAEGCWVYLHELHYYDTAAMWIAMGTLLALTMTRGLRELRWLPLTVTAALAAEILLTQIYAQTF